MMENRAYEDEPNKQGHHNHHFQHPHQYQQHQQQPQPQQPSHSHMHQHHPHPQDGYLPDHPQMTDRNHHQHHHHRHQQQLPRFETYRGVVGHSQHSDCHVYEDIVAPYGLALEPGGCAGGFHRNLTLPLRRTSQSCESLDANLQSSSVRVTNRERTRGSVIDRLNRDDRNRYESEEGSSRGDDSLSSAERPARRRRKKDCKHCKIKAGAREEPGGKQQQQQQQRDEQLAVYEERSAELRAIFGLPDSSVCRLAPGCLSAAVVYAIGCNGTDCNNAMGTESPVTTSSTSTTTTASSRFAHAPEGSFDDKALIAPPTTKGGGGRAAGMKVNSIYAQEHWQHAAKDPRIFLNDPKDQNSPFQRAYSAVSASSPSSENRANLRRSVRDEPAPHPARLRKHRHGWTLHFGRPLGGTTCTKSLVLLLIVVLALLGIGGIALYIVFEPEKLHVIQQYLRSTARNSTSPRNGTSFSGPEFEEPGTLSGTSLPPTSTLLDALLFNATVSSINTNNVPGGPGNDSNDLDDTEPIFVTTWSTTASTRTSTSTPPPPVTTTTSAPASSSSSSAFLETHSRRRRPCNECRADELCLARNADEAPFCRSPLDPDDSTGCGGLCDDKSHKCHKLDSGALRCTETEHHCLDDEWTCLNILCIPLVKRCDGQMNCYDHSDEYNCECNLETHFHCGNQTSCLPLSKKCDGHVDCFDATDEENCTSSHELGRLCPSKDEFTCRNNHQCIKRSRFCDGYRDCGDGSDEPGGCQYRDRCNKSEFTCHNARCIDKTNKCNGIDDCGDGSDELHCIG